MNRLVCGVIFCFLLSVGTGSSEGADRPNIVFLFADDQRADTIAAHGNSHIQTPHLDRLVREGVSCHQN